MNRQYLQPSDHLSNSKPSPTDSQHSTSTQYHQGSKFILVIKGIFGGDVLPRLRRRRSETHSVQLATNISIYFYQTVSL